MNTSIIVGCVMILIASMLAASIITSIWIDDTYVIYPGAKLPIAPGEYVKVQTMLSDGRLYCMRIRYHYDESNENDYHESIISVGYATLKELEEELANFLECDIKLIYKKRG